MGMILGFARVVPFWAWLVIALVAWGGFQRWRANSAAATYQQAQIEAAKATEAALAENIRETARRLAEQQKVTTDAELKLTKARSDAAGAAGAAERLRRQLVALRAASAPTGDPSASGAGTAGRLAEVLGECVDQYRTVAAAADRAVVAGRTCEASYNALTK